MEVNQVVSLIQGTGERSRASRLWFLMKAEAKTKGKSNIIIAPHFLETDISAYTKH
jgi:hypothetical protein